MKKFVTKTKNLALKKAKGVIAVEWVICCPFALLITFTSIMMVIFTIDFHLISKNTSQLVSDLNLGDSGYIQGRSDGMHMDDFIRTGTYTRDSDGLGRRQGNANVFLNITRDKDRYFFNTSKYFIHEINNNGGFTAPYCRLTGIDCRVYRNFPDDEVTDFSVEKGKTESGDMVVVTTTYRFCGVIPVTTRSFGFIN